MYIVFSVEQLRQRTFSQALEQTFRAGYHEAIRFAFRASVAGSSMPGPVWVLDGVETAVDADLEYDMVAGRRSAHLPSTNANLVELVIVLPKSL
jgi:hypothetical protein